MADIIELSKSINRVNQNVAAQGNTFRQISGENNRNVTKITKDIGSYFIQQRGSLDNVAESTKQNATAIESLGRKIDNNSNLTTQSISSIENVANLLTTTNRLLAEIARNTKQSGGLGGALGQAAGAAAGDTGGGLSRAANLAGAFAALGGKTALGVSAMGLMGTLNNASLSMGGGKAPAAGVTPSTPAGGATGGGTTPSGSGTAGSSTLTGPAKKILDHMADSEGSNYNTQFGYQNTTSGKKLTEMTIGEVREAQARQRGSSAIGRYQFMAKTLPEAMKGTGLTDRDMFSAENQDKLAMWLLKRRGYDKWVSGQLSDRDFGRNLSMEWASVPNPYTGGSYYGQKVKYGSDVLLKALLEAKGSAGGQPTPQSSPGGAAATPQAPTSTNTPTGAPPQQKGALPNSPKTAGDKNQNIPTPQTREDTKDTKQGVRPQTPAGGASDHEQQNQNQQQQYQIRDGRAQLKTQSGVPYEVDAKYAKNFEGFVKDLEATGYKINTISSYRPGATVKGSGKPSFHSRAMAIDINATANPHTFPGSANYGKTDLPANVGSIAAKHGLGWGGNWRSSKDTMHFSAGASEGATASGGQAQSQNAGVSQQPDQGQGQQGLGAAGGMMPNLGGLGGLGGMGMLGMMPGMGMMGGRMGVFGALAGMALGGLGALGSAAAAPSMPSGPTPSTPALQAPQTGKGFVSPFAGIDSDNPAQFFAADKQLQSMIQNKQIQTAALESEANRQKPPTVNVTQPQQTADQQKTLLDQQGRSDMYTVVALWEKDIFKWLGIKEESNFG